ncbi:uncharacterized protein LOC127933095 isoform X2 [Oncorhynchus keta]|uniref:uncharacterized protein LOC127933095 isoform X2 n=1 Tax=Oncorhynchus keta TaxID=8018 RepID=UPI00227A8CEA|nr:uncharacterized protein LOC127933095 isoform X2 [Oncorhynchus keta]
MSIVLYALHGTTCAFLLPGSPVRLKTERKRRRYQPVLAPWHQSQTEAPAVDNWFRHAEETWEAAHVHLQRAIRLQKIGADRRRSESPVFAPGDRVWLSTRNLPLRLLCRKLGPRFVGPFKVLRRVNKADGGWPAPGG